MLLHTRIFDIIGIVVLIFSTAFSLYMEKGPDPKDKKE